MVWARKSPVAMLSMLTAPAGPCIVSLQWHHQRFSAPITVGLLLAYLRNYLLYLLIYLFIHLFMFPSIHSFNKMGSCYLSASLENW